MCTEDTARTRVCRRYSRVSARVMYLPDSRCSIQGTVVFCETPAGQFRSSTAMIAEPRETTPRRFLPVRGREARERERETRGYEPFALYLPIHWAILGVRVGEMRIAWGGAPSETFK